MPDSTWSPPATAVDPAYFPITKRFRFGWAVEAAVLVVLLLLHDMLRNAVMGSRYTAFDNAKTLTSIERFLGIYHEQAIQKFFIDAGTVVIGFWNTWFETMHFLVPLVVAVYLYRKFPGRYVRMRNAFLVMLFLTAPLVWAVFPVTPPKFMPARYGFVDTEAEYWNIVPQDPLKYGPDPYDYAYLASVGFLADGTTTEQWSGGFFHHQGRICPSVAVPSAGEGAYLVRCEELGGVSYALITRDARTDGIWVLMATARAVASHPAVDVLRPVLDGVVRAYG